MGEIAALPISFAGHDACVMCHQEVYDLKKTGKHAESLARRATAHSPRMPTTPRSWFPSVPIRQSFALDVMRRMRRKPKTFPQVDSTAITPAAWPATPATQPHKPGIDMGVTAKGGKP